MTVTRPPLNNYRWSRRRIHAIRPADTGKGSNIFHSTPYVMDTLPGLYSTYTAADGAVSTYARFAAFDERSDPIKAFVFNAKTYTVEGVEVTPIKEQHEDTDEHNYVAEYIGPTTTNDITETGVIFYHFDEFDGLCKQERITTGEYESARDSGELPPLPSFVQYYILSELHELCHWAIPTDQQPDDDGHSAVWNAILMDAIAHSTDINPTPPDFEYTFTDDENRSVTVPDVDQEMPIPMPGGKTDQENEQQHLPTGTDPQ